MRNAEASRERILQAATAEFAEHGVAGARVDRIAATAGCNKNLIYIYFGSKEALFTTVLERNLLRVYEDLAFTPDDLPGYATRVFDFAMANPDLARLITWAGLERRAESPAARGTAHAEKIAALTRSQTAGRTGAGFSPGFLLTAVMTLATAWTAANPFGPAIDPEAAGHPAGLRESVTAAIALLAGAQPADD